MGEGGVRNLKKLPSSFMDGPAVFFFWPQCADFCHCWTLDDAVNAQKVFQHMWPCVSNYLTIIINLSRKLLVSNYKSFLRFGKDSSLVVSVCNAWLKQAIQACPSACLPAACPTGHQRREPQFLRSGRKELCSRRLLGHQHMAGIGAQWSPRSCCNYRRYSVK